MGSQMIDGARAVYSGVREMAAKGKLTGEAKAQARARLERLAEDPTQLSMLLEGLGTLLGEVEARRRAR